VQPKHLPTETVKNYKNFNIHSISKSQKSSIHHFNTNVKTMLSICDKYCEYNMTDHITHIKSVHAHTLFQKDQYVHFSLNKEYKSRSLNS
jgi:hypothetical protein